MESDAATSYTAVIDLAELTAIASRLGKLPTPAEYLKEMGVIDANKASVYRYMNFDQIEEYAEVARGVPA